MQEQVQEADTDTVRDGDRRRPRPSSSGRRSSKLHRCERCGKNFSRKEHLRRHALNHTRNQVWACGLCADTFVRKDLWQRHCNLKHPGSAAAANSNSNSTPAPSSSSPWVDGDGPSLPACGSAEPGLATESPPSRDMMNPPGVAPSEWTESSLWPNWWVQEPPAELGFDMDMSWLFGTVQGEGEGEALHGHTNDIASLTPTAVPADLETQIDPMLPVLADAPDPDAGGFCFDLASPTCAFRVCRSLTAAHRTQLLEMLSADLAYLDPGALTRASLQQGVHLFCRFVSKEYPIVHSYHLIPPAAARETLSAHFGLESSPELLWAVITMGWTVLDQRRYAAYHSIARKIQSILRKRVIAHPLLQLAPPIWLVQTLFLCLTFARYHGCREANGFATVFHGVLIKVVNRIDLHDPHLAEFSAGDGKDSAVHAWYAWIRDQSKKRVVFQTFVLDIQQALLHGGEFSMSPFNLTVCIPESDDAWFSESHELWLRHRRPANVNTPDFLLALKVFWNSSTIKHTSPTFPRAVKLLMYGILALSYDMKRRNDNSFSTKTLYTSETLGARVSRSFQQWLHWWDKTCLQPQVETIHLWRNCACVFRLGHTLYEVDASTWRTLAGVDCIDGKRVGAADYAMAKRSTGAWAKSDMAGLGVSYAAALILERLSPAYKPEAHCEHCNWCFYIAGLICWGLEFITSGSSSTVQITSMRQAREDCDQYLAATVGTRNTPHQMHHSKKTAGLLYVLLDLFREVGDAEEHLVEESIRSLSRITGSNLHV